jgi:hypothetical protein
MHPTTTTSYICATTALLCFGGGLVSAAASAKTTSVANSVDLDVMMQWFVVTATLACANPLYGVNDAYAGAVALGCTLWAAFGVFAMAPIPAILVQVLAPSASAAIVFLYWTWVVAIGFLCVVATSCVVACCRRRWVRVRMRLIPGLTL